MVEWRDIPSCPELQASSGGQIRSNLDRVNARWKCGGVKIYQKNESVVR